MKRTLALSLLILAGGLLTIVATQHVFATAGPELLNSDVDLDSEVSAILGAEVEPGEEPETEVDCEDEDDGEDCETFRVTICHIPPGNPGKAKTITICEVCLDDHLAHGDFVGPCNG